jgi:hypothetical protein
VSDDSPSLRNFHEMLSCNPEITLRAKTTGGLNASGLPAPSPAVNSGSQERSQLPMIRAAHSAVFNELRNVGAILSLTKCILYDKSLGTSKLNVLICNLEPRSPSWILGTHKHRSACSDFKFDFLAAQFFIESPLRLCFQEQLLYVMSSLQCQTGRPSVRREKRGLTIKATVSDGSWQICECTQPV